MVAWKSLVIGQSRSHSKGINTRLISLSNAYDISIPSSTILMLGGGRFRLRITPSQTHVNRSRAIVPPTKLARTPYRMRSFHFLY